MQMYTSNLIQLQNCLFNFSFFKLTKNVQNLQKFFINFSTFAVTNQVVLWIKGVINNRTKTFIAN